MWLHHHVGDQRDYLSLVRTGEINSIEGAIKMVVGGLGAAVIPRHCIQPQLDRGEVFEYRGGNPKPLTNTIYVARIREAAQSRRVRQVLAWFFEMLEAAPTPRPKSSRNRAERVTGVRRREDVLSRRPA